MNYDNNAEYVDLKEKITRLQNEISRVKEIENEHNVSLLKKWDSNIKEILSYGDWRIGFANVLERMEMAREMARQRESYVNQYSEIGLAAKKLFQEWGDESLRGKNLNELALKVGFKFQNRNIFDPRPPILTEVGTDEEHDNN